jgi:hypothetical protein
MNKSVLAKISAIFRGDHYALVTAGRVSCPHVVNGDIEVDRCFSCPYFDCIVESKAGEEWLQCSPR